MGVTHPSFVILSGLIKRAWRFRLQTDRSGICDLIFEKDVGPLSKQIVWLDLWVCVFNEFINLYGSHASLLYYLCFLFILLFIALCCSCLGLMVFLLVCIPHVALIHQYMDMYHFFSFFSFLLIFFDASDVLIGEDCIAQNSVWNVVVYAYVILKKKMFEMCNRIIGRCCLIIIIILITLMSKL